ncbi:MAG: DUF3775 domain-containing protein [Rhizomicrobium sp.]
MLQHLKETDIDAVIAACRGVSGAPDAGKSLENEELSFAGRDRVYSLIEALPREAQDELLALMWTGGPRNHSSYEENLELAQKSTDDNHAVHLSEQAASLPAYLREGMKKMSGQ